MVPVKSGILAGIGDYAIEGTVLEFPKSWPIPEHLPKPLTHRIWAEEGAKVLEQGQIIPGHLASAHVIAARVTGADPKVLAAVIRGAVADQLNRIRVPVLVLNGRRGQPKALAFVERRGFLSFMSALPVPNPGASRRGQNWDRAARLSGPPSLSDLPTIHS